MTKFGSDDLAINFDNASGTPVDVSAEILEFNGLDVEALLEESHGFGETFAAMLFCGVKRLADITLSGFYDDLTPDGTDEIFNAIGNTTTRTLAVTWGGTNISSVETVIKRYVHRMIRRECTKFEVVLMATGAVTEAP